jgi:hypothetical protein
MIAQITQVSFPTAIRATSHGAVFLVGKLAGPYLILRTALRVKGVIGVILTVTTASNLVFVTMVPETKGVTMGGVIEHIVDSSSTSHRSSGRQNGEASGENEK